MRPHTACSIETSSWYSRIVLLVVVIFSTLQFFVGAWDYSYTYDEDSHLGWSNRLLLHGETERESQSNFISTTPVIVPNIVLTKALFAVKKLEKQELRFYRRSANVFWLLLTIGASYYCAYTLAGHAAARGAAIIVALEPNIIAHMSVLTVDGAFAAVVITTLAALFCFHARPSFVSTAAVGGWLGYGFATKFSVLIVLPVIVLAFIIALCKTREQWLRKLGYFCVFILVGALVASAAYGFKGLFLPLREIPFRSGLFQGMASILPGLRLPLPESILTGIDLCFLVERQSAWNVIFLGRWYPWGTLWYFPVLWLLKTPIAILVFNVVGISLLIHKKLWRYCTETKVLLSLLLFSGLYFVFVFKTQIGYRYILFLLPPLAVLAACGWSTLVKSLSNRVSAFIALILMLELLPYTGSQLAFSNIIIPKNQEYKYLADSNFEWGQNYEREQLLIKQLDEALPEGQEFHHTPMHILPGFNLVFVNDLLGVWWNYERYQWLRNNLEPEQIYFRTAFLYHVSDQAFRKYLLEERSIYPHKQAEERCAGEAAYKASAAPYGIKGSPGVSTICVDAEVESTLRFVGQKGHAKFSALNSWGECSPKVLPEGRELWFVLQAGKHAFCLQEATHWQGQLELNRLEVPLDRLGE
jgi:hypothetical protein